MLNRAGLMQRLQCQFGCSLKPGIFVHAGRLLVRMHIVQQRQFTLSIGSRQPINRQLAGRIRFEHMV